MSGTGRLNKDIYAKQSIKSGIAFHQGDVLYGKLRPYLQNWLLPTFDGLAVGDFWVLQPQNADSSFLYRLIQSRQFDEVANQSTGTKMPRADWKLVSKTVFSIPSNISEQAAIGTYFTALDSLITLHQRQHFLHSTPDISLSVRLIHPFYTSSWEQRKLGEVAKYRNGKAHENCIDESGKYIVVNSKFVSTNGTVIKHSNMQNEPLAQNEIAFVLSDVPNGRAIARTFLVEENDKYTLNQRIAGITSSENTYPYFLHILMNRHPYFLAFDDGVKQTNLSVSDVLNFETYYPEYEEQKQIGEYFRNLDRRITLHQRKGKAAVSGCSNDANNSKGVCCKARDFGYKCHKKDEPNRFDA